MIDKEHKFCIGKNDHSWEVGYNKGYQQGRADAEEEAENRMNGVLDDEKKLSYEQGKADAFEKFKNFIRNNKNYFVGDMAEMLIYEFEQMHKEQK